MIIVSKPCELIRRLILALLCVLIVFSARAIDGSWSGYLNLGQAKLKLVFNFTYVGAGITLCTLDSPMQGAKDIPAIIDYSSADSLAISIKSIGATFNGKIIGNNIKGQFTQRSYTFPLDLERELSLLERRPQTPQAPYPYLTIDTSFVAQDGYEFHGTLTLPEGADSNIPAVIMVTGSGIQNRDEEIFEHRPFAVIADHLARNGIASLRYDDRGYNKPGDVNKRSTTQTFADDARAAMKLLRSLPMTGKCGVLGHSEGGTIALMLGATGDADFVISLAGMAETGKELLLRQNRNSLISSGMSETAIENTMKIIDILFDEMAGQYSQGLKFEIDVDSIIASSGLDIEPNIVTMLKQSQQSRSTWLDAFISLDPSKFLGKIKCPVLAINGAKDKQVDADANLSIISKKVRKTQILKLENLNHLLQHCQSGEITEYESIRETIAPEVLTTLTTFIQSH